MSKIESVLNYLKSGKTITSIEAFELFRATRLSAIIFELRNRGYNIQTIERKGDKCVYAEYKLINQNKEVANV
jgi:hypothetical protein